MAEGAAQAECLRLASRAAERHDAKNRLGVDQRQRVGRVVEIDGAVRDRGKHRPWNRIDIELEADGECGRGADPRAHTAKSRAADRLVQLERIAPEPLVAEGITAKDLTSAVEQIAVVLLNRRIEGSR